MKLEFNSLRKESNASSCAEFQCGQGWTPKSDHHIITSAPSNSKCCEATCELWTCGPNYLKNTAYDTNIGSSDPVCCDRTCMDDFQCPPNYTTRGIGHRGASVAECCGALCPIYECPDDWLPDASDVKKTTLADSPESCCLPTCALFNCSATPGYVTDSTNLGNTGNTNEACCDAGCYMYTCPLNKKMPAEKNETVGSQSDCCDPLCSGFTCDDGYAMNASKSTEFGNSISECCLTTCALHSCSGDWANSTAPSKLSGVNITDELCCEPSCSAYTCSTGQIPKKGVAEDAGNSDLTCCDATCSIYTCSSLTLRKRNETVFNDTRGYDDALCCEPAGCSVMDNRTATAIGTEGCNSLSEDVCDSHYMLFTKNTTGAGNQEESTTFAVACEWWGAKGLPICRNSGTPLVGCTVSL